MLIGHYGAGFAAKAINRSIPLWVLILAAQLIDVFWASFVLLGVEKVRIVPGATASNPLDLYYMPYTHGLLSALGWSILAMLVYRSWRSEKTWRPALIVAAVVFSHWMFDLIVHRTDLPLVGGSTKVGLGLWNAPALALALEIGLLVGGIGLYMARDKLIAGRVRAYILAWGAVIIGVQCLAVFGAPPKTDIELALTALVLYFGFAGFAYWIEKRAVAQDMPKSPAVTT